MFDTNLLSLLVSQKVVGIMLLDPLADVIFKLKKASDLIKANELFFKAYTVERHWRTLEYLEVSRESLGGLNGGSYIHPTAILGEDCSIGPNAYIGRGVVVGKGSRIAESIILGGTEIGDHCVVLRSLIGFNTEIANWCRIEGSSERDNITIIGIGAKLEPEVHIYDCLVLPNKHAFVSYYNQTVL